MWYENCAEAFNEEGEIMTNGLPIYYVQEELSEKLGNSYWVYIHYPNTGPDMPCMAFKFKENAELVCKVMNADKQGKQSGIVYKRGVWLHKEGCELNVFECSVCGHMHIASFDENDCYCCCCGADMRGDHE